MYRSQNHSKIDVHPAAPMVLQGGPEVPKSAPRVLRGAKMDPRRTKMDAPSSPNGNPEETEGAGARGRSPSDK